MFLLCGMTSRSYADVDTVCQPESSASLAQDERIILVIENDMWGSPPTDRNYTMGASYMGSQKGIPKNCPALKLLGELSFVNQLTGINDKGFQNDMQSNWVIGSSAFTPKDITSSAPSFQDRPYASLLYFGTGYRTVPKLNAVITETQLRLGILGTSFARVVQTGIHRWCCADRLPQGWDNQIGDGGSPTFLYHMRRLKPFINHSARENLTYSLLASGGFEVGYYTRALAGLSLFYGTEKADFDCSYLNPVMALPSAGVTGNELHCTKGSGFSFWVDYELSAFAYNELLQGSLLGHNNVMYSRSEMETFVQKINAGFELTGLLRSVGILTKTTDFRTYLTGSWRSRDLRNIPDNSHSWGGVILSWTL